MNTRILATRLALLVGGCILAAPAPAQGQGGGQGGGRGRMPFLMGNVTAVNAQAGTLTVQPQFGGGDPQTVQVSPQTQMMSQEAAAVADLKVGDTIQVQGVPTALTASTITIGQMPNMFGGRPGGGAGGPGGGGGAQGGAARAGGAGGPGQAANASASGKITSLSPLTIALSDSATLTLKLASDAKLTRLKTVALSGVKVGDQVVASGQAGQDGTFAANMVGVNMQMGGMMGGFGGGGRGYNGPRGFGGPPPPGGGFGGPPPPAAPPQN